MKQMTLFVLICFSFGACKFFSTAPMNHYQVLSIDCVVFRSTQIPDQIFSADNDRKIGLTTDTTNKETIYHFNIFSRVAPDFSPNDTKSICRGCKCLVDSITEITLLLISEYDTINVTKNVARYSGPRVVVLYRRNNPKLRVEKYVSSNFPYLNNFYELSQLINRCDKSVMNFGLQDNIMYDINFKDVKPGTYRLVFTIENAKGKKLTNEVPIVVSEPVK